MLATYRSVSLAAATVVLLFLFFHDFTDGVSSLKSIANIPHEPSKPTLRDAIHTLFDSLRHPITADYVDPSGKTFALDQSPRWERPLKNKILLVDIDTRAPDGENTILDSKKMDWEQFQIDKGGSLVSNAIFDHYLYAQIHGYDYQFFQAQSMEGYYNTWISPHVLKKLLPEYDFVVTMDADVTISHPEVPLEWLFNHWGITNNTSISLPWDQKEMRGNDTISTDSKGQLVLNTGLMVVQNLAYTKEMLQAWIDCPTEKTYQGCGQWKEEWSHEQRAFSEYIRYDFNPDNDNIVPIPCDDAVGWPGMQKEYPDRLGSDCNGNFFRHHTLDKQKTKDSVSVAVMQLMVQLFQNSFLEDQDKLWYKEPPKDTTKPEVGEDQATQQGEPQETRS